RIAPVSYGCEPLRHRRRAGGVEPEAVDQRLVFGEPEQTRPRVARLGQRGDGADLHESKPERRPGPQPPPRLVEPAGEADRRGKSDPADGGLQERVPPEPAYARPHRAG